MSPSLVICAIPREDDPIWQVSSEKVPHLTILFLGSAENPNSSKIASFVEHASGMMLSRFGLDVDRRGELGEDKADVLFFQDNWELPRLREFRSQLLKNNNIRKAYDSAPQFGAPQDWTPHLTLGYPDSPAKPTKERIYWVQFDRIAVWTGDYEGDEFVLKNDYGMEESSVAWSDTAAAGRQFLAHYGVKGMKWGVRRNRAATSVTTETIVNAGLRGKTKVKAKGGVAQDASPDAVKAAAQKQKLKKSGAAALSNQELAELGTRLQLEVNVKRLSEETSSSGRKFVKKRLGSEAQRVGSQEVTSFVDKAVRAAKKR
jgi:2'-5' RNA ligase